MRYCEVWNKRDIQAMWFIFSRGTHSKSISGDGLIRPQNGSYHLRSWRRLIPILRNLIPILRRLISTMRFPILVRWHLYIESGPWQFSPHCSFRASIGQLAMLLHREDADPHVRSFSHTKSPSWHAIKSLSSHNPSVNSTFAKATLSVLASPSLPTKSIKQSTTRSVDKTVISTTPLLICEAFHIFSPANKFDWQRLYTFKAGEFTVLPGVPLPTTSYSKDKQCVLEVL